MKHCFESHKSHLQHLQMSHTKISVVANDTEEEKNLACGSFDHLGEIVNCWMCPMV